jgi:hypothetical protein
MGNIGEVLLEPSDAPSEELPLAEELDSAISRTVGGVALIDEQASPVMSNTGRKCFIDNCGQKRTFYLVPGRPSVLRLPKKNK